MDIQITDKQVKQIAIAWIQEQHKDESGAKDVLDALFDNAHFAVWSWHDLLAYAVKRCAKNYFMKLKDVVEGLK